MGSKLDSQLRSNVILISSVELVEWSTALFIIAVRRPKASEAATKCGMFDFS